MLFSSFSQLLFFSFFLFGVYFLRLYSHHITKVLQLLMRQSKYEVIMSMNNKWLVKSMTCTVKSVDWWDLFEWNTTRKLNATEMNKKHLVGYCGDEWMTKWTGGEFITQQNTTWLICILLREPKKWLLNWKVRSIYSLLIAWYWLLSPSYPFYLTKVALNFIKFDDAFS